MQQEDVQILEDIRDSTIQRRRQLLPLWIRIFTWLFLITGAIVIILIPISLAGYPTALALYGLEANSLDNFTGVLIASIFFFKGIAAYGLWMEKDWAIILALVDAITGIAICVWVKCLLPLFYEGWDFSIPLELVLLIPYALKLYKIKELWQKI